MVFSHGCSLQTFPHQTDTETGEKKIIVQHRNTETGEKKVIVQHRNTETGEKKIIVQHRNTETHQEIKYICPAVVIYIFEFLSPRCLSTSTTVYW